MTGFFNQMQPQPTTIEPIVEYQQPPCGCASDPDFTRLLSADLRQLTKEELFLRRVSDCKGVHLGLLLQVALQDLEAVERTPGYKIDMNHWLVDDEAFATRGRGTCYACLAGSVMVNSMGITARPKTWDEASGLISRLFVENKTLTGCYSALNAARQGRINHAANYIRRPLPRGFCDRPVCSYDISPFEFKQNLSAIAAELLELEPPC